VLLNDVSGFLSSPFAGPPPGGQPPAGPGRAAPAAVAAARATEALAVAREDSDEEWEPEAPAGPADLREAAGEEGPPPVAAIVVVLPNDASDWHLEVLGALVSSLGVFMIYERAWRADFSGASNVPFAVEALPTLQLGSSLSTPGAGSSSEGGVPHSSSSGGGGGGGGGASNTNGVPEEGVCSGMACLGGPAGGG